MSINLKKGNTFNLTKKEPALKKAIIGLGWEVKPGKPLDLDASVFLVGSNGKLSSDSNFVFYNNLKSPDGSIQHTGDNRTGVGDEDDEVILLNLGLISPSVHEIIVVVTIHDAEERRHNFGMLSSAYIRLMDVETKREILNYDLDEQSPSYTGLEFGRLQRINDEWVFKATGNGNNAGLQGFLDIFS